MRVCFVCLGNICRSPMAEFILKDMINKSNLDMDIEVESRATCYDEIGNDMYYLAKEKLTENNIPFTKRKASILEREDYKKYDYIIGMNDSNIRDIMYIVGNDLDKKVYKLLDFSKKSRDISDPWYTRDFEKAYQDIYYGCTAFLEFLKNKCNK